MFSKKAISPVVAIALLLVVSVFAVVGFQNWYVTYSSNILSNAEISSTSGNAIVIEDLIGDFLYLNNNIVEGYNLTELQIDGVNCSLPLPLDLGINIVNLSSCINNISINDPYVMVMSDTGIVEKKFYVEKKVTSSLILSEASVSGPIYTNTFITVWNTSIDAGLDSVSVNNQIVLPLQSDGDYNFTIDWGDSNIENITIWDDVRTNHTYASPGIYEVRITGKIIGWAFNNGNYWSDDEHDGDKLLEVKAWGSLNLGNSGTYFANCENFIFSGTDSLNLSGTKNLSFMFAYATNFEGNIYDWNTSNITDMKFMFYDADSFNQPLNNWDTSSVIYTDYMFSKASSFNQSLSNFNTSKVTDMKFMFSGAWNFNQPLDNFDTRQVTDIRYMFNGASSFNQPVSNFNTSKVTDMERMFSGAGIFNQPLDNFDTRQVTDMDGMFSRAYNFNQSISNFNTSKVRSMSLMFEHATNFSQPLNNFDTRQVTSMHGMFAHAVNFNHPLDNFDTTQVNNMHLMFYDATIFNQSLNSFDTSQVTSMSWMFWDAKNFNQPLYHFNTSKVIDMSHMFRSIYNFNQDISNWDVSNVIEMDHMFDSTIIFNQNLSTWNVSGVGSHLGFDNNVPAWVLPKPSFN